MKMLSYLIVIIKPKKTENSLHTDEKTDWHGDIQTDAKTKRKCKKNPTLSFANAGAPDTDYLHYSLNVAGITQKGALLLAHIR